MGQRFYWLKLKDDFFTSKRIKKLRNIAGGDTYTIIYLKMQLLALKTDGVIQYTGLEKTFAEELALDLDESPDDVCITLSYLSNVGLMETSDNINYLLPYVVENTGSEGSSAQRMREYRERKLSHCDTGVTHLLQVGDVEKEIDKEKEKEKDIEKDICANDADKSDQKEAFERFWEAYPKKRDKAKAEAAFKKAIKKTTIDVILSALNQQKKSKEWQKENGQYIPYPTTWLNGERWNDELGVESKPIDYGKEGLQGW